MISCYAPAVPVKEMKSYKLIQIVFSFRLFVCSFHPTPIICSDNGIAKHTESETWAWLIYFNVAMDGMNLVCKCVPCDTDTQITTLTHLALIYLLLLQFF